MEDKKPDLRKRQLHQTRALLRETAFNLFEERGVAAVTVDDITQAAGVSPRTFFRHFPVKEYAASLGVEMLAEAVEGFTPSGSTLAEVFTGVMDLFGQVADDPDAHGPGGPLRFQKLMLANPELRAASASREAEITETLSQRLIQSCPELGIAQLLLLAETALSVWRAAWAAWTHAVIENPNTDLTPRVALQWCAATLSELHGD